MAFCSQYWNEIQMGEYDFIYLYKCQLIGCILLPDNVYNRYYNRYPNNQAYILHISVIICHMLHLRRILNKFSNICRRSIHFHNLVSMFHSYGRIHYQHSGDHIRNCKSQNYMVPSTTLVYIRHDIVRFFHHTYRSNSLHISCKMSL